MHAQRSRFASVALFTSLFITLASAPASAQERARQGEEASGGD